ncbi:MAG: hypothetical protein IKY92_05740 [Akkermansia sp.]|nr:hypothetical protein [Akkermansia sp.]
MRNRLFLLALVAALLLVQAVLRTAAMATPLSSATLWGTYTFWELRGVLPLGVFIAGALLVTTAAAAQCAQAALLIAGRYQQLTRTLGSIASTGLWCGAPCLASCYNVLPHIFAWLSGYYEAAPWQTAQYLDWVLHGSCIALILCRVLSTSRKQICACIILPLSLLCLLACGQMWFNAAMILLPPGILGAAGGVMLIQKRKSSVLLTATAFVTNGLLFTMFGDADYQSPPASPIALDQTVWITYACTLLLLAPALYLKATSLCPPAEKNHQKCREVAE